MLSWKGWQMCVKPAGKSACGKKEAKPCGTLVRTVALVASRHKALERGTNGGACEPHEGAGSKAAATYRDNEKEA